MRLLYLLASGRTGGNAEAMARHAAAAHPSHEHVFLRLSDHPLPPFVDYRRREDYAALRLDEPTRYVYESTVAADILVFVAPVYWYSFPSDLKRYLDHWSTWMRVPGLDFRAAMAGKRLLLLSAMAGEELAEAEPLVRAAELTAGYMRMAWVGSVVATGASEAGEVLEREGVLAAAVALVREAVRSCRSRDAGRIPDPRLAR